MAKNKTPVPKPVPGEDTDWMKNDPTTVEAPKKTDKKVKPVGKTAKAENVKPGAKAPPKTEKKGRPSRIGDKKLKVVEAKLGERATLMKRIALAFGKGKTSAEVIDALEGKLEVPRSKVYTENPRGFIQGYISAAFNAGAIVEV